LLASVGIGVPCSTAVLIILHSLTDSQTFSLLSIWSDPHVRKTSKSFFVSHGKEKGNFPHIEKNLIRQQVSQTYNGSGPHQLRPMFKKFADMPINLPINRESLGERYDYSLSV
jgi:hypothetical protein